MYWPSPLFLYGGEVWAFRKKDKKRLTSTEMKFFRKTAGCNLFDHKWNEEIAASRTS
jgi:hypothetical protein